MVNDAIRSDVIDLKSQTFLLKLKVKGGDLQSITEYRRNKKRVAQILSGHVKNSEVENA